MVTGIITSYFCSITVASPVKRWAKVAVRVKSTAPSIREPAQHPQSEREASLMKVPLPAQGRTGPYLFSWKKKILSILGSYLIFLGENVNVG